MNRYGLLIVVALAAVPGFAKDPTVPVKSRLPASATQLGSFDKMADVCVSASPTTCNTSPACCSKCGGTWQTNGSTVAACSVIGWAVPPSGLSLIPPANQLKPGLNSGVNFDVVRFNK